MVNKIQSEQLIQREAELLEKLITEKTLTIEEASMVERYWLEHEEARAKGPTALYLLSAIYVLTPIVWFLWLSASAYFVAVDGVLILFMLGLFAVVLREKSGTDKRLSDENERFLGYADIFWLKQTSDTSTFETSIVLLLFVAFSALSLVNALVAFLLFLEARAALKDRGQYARTRADIKRLMRGECGSELAQ